MSYDAVRNVTCMYATHGKDRYLLDVSDTMSLSIIRKLPKVPSDIFWLTTGLDGSPVAVFWSMDATTIVPLQAESKANKLAGAMERRAVFATQAPGLFGVTKDQRVCGFDGARWSELDVAAPDGFVLQAATGDAMFRTLRPAPWQPLFSPQQQTGLTGRTISAVTSGHTHWFVAVGSDTFLCEVGTTRVRKIDSRGGWCAVGLKDRFLVAARNTVWSVDLDGVIIDMGVGCDDPPDNALFACGSQTFYFTQTSVVHRLEHGAWSAHNMAVAGASIGLA
jgi:hypothetical protein